MNLLKYIFGTNKCTPECSTAFDALEEQAEVNKSLRREIHTRQDEIMYLSKRLEDRQGLINRLQEQLSRAHKNKPRHKKRENVAERAKNEEGNSKKTST